MVALTVYGSTTASTTLTTANKLATAAGGTETNKITTAPGSGSNLYMEALAQGGSGTTSASLPAASGKGFLLDATTLEGNTIAAGNWSAVVAVADTLGSGPLGNMTIRFSKRSSGGSYTTIGTIVVTSPTVNTTRTTYSFTATSMSAMAFATGDKLYVDFFYFAGSSPWSGDTMALYQSTSSATGVTNDLMVTTPGYSATGGAVHLRIMDGYGGVFS